jgi:acetoin utilization deacetylase AcuC-like enzyme
MPPAEPIKVVHSDVHLGHAPQHEVQYGIPRPTPEVPARAEEIRRALAKGPGFAFVAPVDHGRDPIEAVHEPGLIRYLEEAWSEWRAWRERKGVAADADIVPDTVLHPALREGMGPAREPASAIGRIGYWTFETMSPVTGGTYAAARAAVDVALTAADLVLAGDRAAFGLCRPPGHHSPRAAFGGYCYFNNAAVAAEHIVRRTGEPVAILDVDYHHGNGTQQIFYERGDVLYASLHGDPDRAYPYFAGFAEEVGAGPGWGANLNIPLPAWCTDEQYLRSLTRACEAVDGFGGSVLVVSLGLDTFGADPLSDLAVTSDLYEEMGRRVASLGRRLVILLEGGYHLPSLGANTRSWLLGAGAGVAAGRG